MSFFYELGRTEIILIKQNQSGYWILQWGVKMPWSKLITFFTKTEKTPRKFLYFGNRHNSESTKIGHNF